MVLDAKYLSERGLYDQCQERLQNAKELSVRLDDNLVLLEVLKEERRIIRDRRAKNYETLVAKLSMESESVLQHISDEMWYLAIYEKLVNIVLA